ncbi:TonB-dependent receptor plug domain-containing protein [Lichenicoccus sp.]|uniref:TonB-dependent receptor plug domain-containing protein n=1 Tax=Lichenicoccus sp. TaxID=2781899 RepID=UPI003D111EFA
MGGGRAARLGGVVFCATLPAMRVDARTAEATGVSAPPAAEQIEVTGARINPVPTTASEFAPSQPSIEETEPQSTVNAETLKKILVPSADYDDVVALTPSAMNINPVGPGLQHDFGQSIRGLQYTEFSVLFDGVPIPGFPFNLAPQPGGYFFSRDFGSVTVNRGPGPASAIGAATFGGSVDGVWGAVERKTYVRTGSSLSELSEAGSRRGRSSSRAMVSGRIKA